MSKLKDFDHLLVPPGKKIAGGGGGGGGDAGGKFRLADVHPDSTRHIPPRQEADAATQKAVQRLGQFQDLLYAEGRRSLLVILQGMDASGKDGTVRGVFDSVNPTGIQVTSFKQPSAEELRHDFLWRCHAKAPPRGYIGVFNRSYYEEVLVVRVHAASILPPELRDDKNEWNRRYQMFNAFERILADAGTRVIKFFLHISKDEQKERFIARQKDPAKHWKLAAGDFDERRFWDDYQHAYEKMLPATSTPHAPWYLIPADHKWARNYTIAHILAATLADMNPKPPKLADKSLITRRFK